MCRMLIVLGKVNMSWLIDDFITMADDNNERHENNEKKPFKHKDGWGIVYLNGNELMMEKSPRPCFEDSRIDSYRNLNSPMVILHARLGSDGKGEAELVNTHPFHYGYYVFCHNGTVKQKLNYESKFVSQGKTDSEELFYYLLSNLNGEMNEQFLFEKLSAVTDYSGMNFILTNGNINFVGNWYSRDPQYYTMKLLADDNFLIISSEVLPHFKDKKWESLKNRSIVRIETETREYSVYKKGRNNNALYN